MIKRHQNREKKLSMVYLDDLVPNDHILRKIDKVINFDFVYDYVEDLYSNTGRPSIDPVVLVKYAFLQRLDNRNSMRATFREAEVNIAYRWFLGYELDEKLPHFSDYSYNYIHKFSKPMDIKDEQGNIIGQKTLFAIIFSEILLKVAEHGFLDLRHIYADSTHIKANANKRKVDKIEVEEECKAYQEELDKEINAYCKEKGLKNPKPIRLKKKTKKVSQIDPECGIFNKGEHEVQAAYLAQTICDDNGFILDTEVNPANLHDSTTLETIYQKVIHQYGVGDGKICSIALDAGYKTPALLRMIFGSGVTPLVPYTSPKGKKNNEDNATKFAKKDFKYDKDKDVYYCPQGYTMTPRGVDRKTGYITYRCETKNCRQCPMRDRCLSKKSKSKAIIRHIWAKYLEEGEKIRHSEYHARHYQRRKETIERVFADAKEKHCARYTRLRGIRKVQDEMYLIFACMNLKKLANWAFK